MEETQGVVTQPSLRALGVVTKCTWIGVRRCGPWIRSFALELIT